VWLSEVAQRHVAVSVTYFILAYFRLLALQTSSTSSHQEILFHHSVSYIAVTGGKCVPAANHHLQLTPDIKKGSKYLSTPLYVIPDIELN
jgi:hypothetical protein